MTSPRSTGRTLSLLLLAAKTGCCGPTATFSSAAGWPDELAELPVLRCGDYFGTGVTLEGQGPYALLLDTGFPRTRLRPSVVAELGGGRSLDSLATGSRSALFVST